MQSHDRMAATERSDTAPEHLEPIPARLMYPLDETAALIGGVSLRTVYRLIGDGHLAAVRVGRRRMVPAAAIRAYVDELTAA